MRPKLRPSQLASGIARSRGGCPNLAPVPVERGQIATPQLAVDAILAPVPVARGATVFVVEVVAVGRPSLPVQGRRRFWAEVRLGMWSVEESAVRAGVSTTTGKKWFREAGGVTPYPARAQGPIGRCPSSNGRRSRSGSRRGGPKPRSPGIWVGIRPRSVGRSPGTALLPVCAGRKLRLVVPGGAGAVEVRHAGAATQAVEDPSRASSCSPRCRPG